MKKLIPLYDFIIKIDSEFPSTMMKDEMQELLINKYKEIVSYAKFLNQEIDFDMFDGENKIFNGLKYHDIQPSTEWNYWTISGRRIFQESNMGTKVRLIRKVSELTDLDLTTTPRRG